jgi:uncharacterized membrane protein
MGMWVWLSLVALTFWGITGVTQKLSTNNISTTLAFIWFSLSFIPMALVIVFLVPLNWNLSVSTVLLAMAGGALNGLGVVTSFTALECGGKASVVIPLVSLYPLITLFLAYLVLGETLSTRQCSGVVLALIAALLLSRETEMPSVEKLSGD